MLADILKTAVHPAFELLPKFLDSREARVMMLAIGLQESRFKHRWQILNGGGKGPARGFWQMELGSKASRGGVWGLYLHRASFGLLGDLCRHRDVSFEPRAIWSRLEGDDVLAAGSARLLLYTNAKPLPKVGDEAGAWMYYLNTWRPGRPHPDTWPSLYAQAVEAVKG